MVISGNKVETKYWNVQLQTGSAIDRSITSNYSLNL